MINKIGGSAESPSYIYGMKKAKQPKPPEFVIFSEDGFFTGLANGGQPQWSMNIKDGKSFDNELKLKGLQSIVRNKELLIEYIN
jgi:hypothetical protein